MNKIFVNVGANLVFAPVLGDHEDRPCKSIVYYGRESE